MQSVLWMFYINAPMQHRVWISNPCTWGQIIKLVHHFFFVFFLVFVMRRGSSHGKTPGFPDLT